MSDTPRPHINAVDAEGNRYTTHYFGFAGQWWLGATILTPNTIAALRRDGKLPLREALL
jgi:hypothetical protein